MLYDTNDEDRLSTHANRKQTFDQTKLDSTSIYYHSLVANYLSSYDGKSSVLTDDAEANSKLGERKSTRLNSSHS